MWKSIEGNVIPTLTSPTYFLAAQAAGSTFIYNKQMFVEGVKVGASNRKDPLRVGFLGDSTALTAVNASTPNNFDITQQVSSAWPTTTAAIVINKQIARDELFNFYPIAYTVVSCGVSGQTSAQVLARDTATASVTRKAILDLEKFNLDVLFIRVGINDLKGITSSNYVSLLAATIKNISIIIDRASSLGIYIVYEGPLGYGLVGPEAVTSVNQLIQQAVIDLNNAIAAYIATNSNIVYLDTTGVTHDDTGAFFLNISDGTHLNRYGQALLSAYEADFLTARFGASPSHRYAGKNISPNPLFLNSTAGLAMGVNAVAGSTGAEFANSVENYDGNVWQKFVVTPTLSASSLYIKLPFTPSTMGLLAGDILGIEFKTRMLGLEKNTPVPTVVVVSADFRMTVGGVATRTVCQLTPDDKPKYGVSKEVRENWIFPPINIMPTIPGAWNDSESLFTLVINAPLTAPIELWVSAPSIIKLI